MTLENYTTEGLLQELHKRNDAWAFIVTPTDVREYIMNFIEDSDRSDAEIKRQLDRISKLSEQELVEIANVAKIQSIFSSWDAMFDLIECIQTELGLAYAARD